MQHGFWSERVDSDKYIGGPIPFNEPQFHPDRLDKPLHWKKPRRIGVCFTGDLFDSEVPYSWQLQVFKKGIEASIQHQFFFLTKQVSNMKDAVLNAFRDRQ